MRVYQLDLINEIERQTGNWEQRRSNWFRRVTRSTVSCHDCEKKIVRDLYFQKGRGGRVLCPNCFCLMLGVNDPETIEAVSFRSINGNKGIEVLWPEPLEPQAPTSDELARLEQESTVLSVSPSQNRVATEIAELLAEQKRLEYLLEDRTGSERSILQGMINEINEKVTLMQGKPLQKYKLKIVSPEFFDSIRDDTTDFVNEQFLDALDGVKEEPEIEKNADEEWLKQVDLDFEHLLAPKQYQIAQMIADGMSRDQVAEKLSIQRGSVNKQLSLAKKKSEKRSEVVVQFRMKFPEETAER